MADLERINPSSLATAVDGTIWFAGNGGIGRLETTAGFARSTSPFNRAVNARRFARPVSGSVATRRSSSARVSAFETAIVASSAKAARRRSSAVLNAKGRAEPAASAPHRCPRVHSGAAMPLRRPASRTSEMESSGATSP